MKKIRVMVLALIVAVALTGAGYAAWGTKITYNNTMKTAEWNVFVENDAPGDSLVAEDAVNNYNANTDATNALFTDVRSYEVGKYDNASNLDKSGAVKDKGENFVYSTAPYISTMIEAADTVNFAFYNMHPGTKVNTRFEIRNAGTIPAKIADVRVILDRTGLNQPSKEVYDAMTVSGTFYDHQGSSTWIPLGHFENIPMNQLDAKLKELLVGKELKEQHSITVIDSSELEVDPGLTFSIPENALKDPTTKLNLGRLGTLPLKIEFDFVQYNQNVPSK